jgi:hypothetical protein
MFLHFNQNKQTNKQKHVLFFLKLRNLFERVDRYDNYIKAGPGIFFSQKINNKTKTKK